MHSGKTAYFILPAYNEAPVIGNLLDKLPRRIKSSRGDIEIRIVVVNDGSTDGTQQIVEKYKDVILINHIINSGVGAATRTGLNYARANDCDFAITMDSDGQHAVNDAKKLLLAANKGKADLIIGSRFKKMDGNMPWYKKLGNYGLGLVTLMLLGVYSSDTQSGLRVLNRKALEKIEYHSNNYAFCSEMIWKAHQAKLRVTEVPIKAIYTDYSLSRGQKNLSGAIDISRHLARRRLLHFLNG